MPRPSTPAELSPADRIRYQLLLAHLNQSTGARALGITPRQMRRYCSGRYDVPRVIDLAMQALIMLRTFGPNKLPKMKGVSRLRGRESAPRASARRGGAAADSDNALW